MKSFDVAVFGRTVWDDWLNEQLPAKGAAEMNFGGPAANVAVHMATLGLAVTLVTVLGTDSRSTRYAQYLRQTGVDLSFAKVSNAPLPACRLSRGKPGTYEWERGDNGMDALAGIDISGPTAAAQAAYFADFPLTAIVGEGLARSSACAPQLALWTGHVLTNLLVARPWRVVFLNNKEATRVATDLSRPIVEQSALTPFTTWIITDEARATRVIRAGEETTFAVEPQAPVCSVGAGDGFAAGVWAGILRGHSISQAVGCGHAIAGRIIQQVGCQLPARELSAIGRQFGFSS